MVRQAVLFPIHGISQARIPPPGDLLNPGIEPRSPALQADSLPSEPPGNPRNTGVGSLSLSREFSQPRLFLMLFLYGPGGSWSVSLTLPVKPQGKPKNTGEGSLSLLQQIFQTQESNRGLLHCRQILYQLIPSSALKGGKDPASLHATPKSSLTRRVPSRGPPGETGMRPRYPCCPWRAILRPGPKPR